MLASAKSAQCQAKVAQAPTLCLPLMHETTIRIQTFIPAINPQTGLKNAFKSSISESTLASSPYLSSKNCCCFSSSLSWSPSSPPFPLISVFCFPNRGAIIAAGENHDLLMASWPRRSILSSRSAFQVLYCSFSWAPDEQVVLPEMYILYLHDSQIRNWRANPAFGRKRGRDSHAFASAEE